MTSARSLIRLWVEKYERGELDEEVETANLLSEYVQRITALERLVGQLTLENDLLKKASGNCRPLKDAKPSVIVGPFGLSVAAGCRVMQVARSVFYDAAAGDPADDTALVERMHAIQGEFPAYGYRRITAQLRADGIMANRKRVARLMRLHGMQVRPRRRYVATTDNDHDGPIFPHLAKEMALDGPDQLWVADITYVAIAIGFVYLAVILDAWSRRVVGYALGRTIDARLTIAALEAAIAARRPQEGCVHHSDRGSQPGFNQSSQRLCELTVSARQKPPQVFSRQGFCEVSC